MNVAKSDDDPAIDSAAVAGRLRLLRMLIGGVGRGSQARFVRELGIASSRWNNVEAGSYRLSLDIALLLVRSIPGLTLDWIYFGRVNPITAPLLRDLSRLSKLMMFPQRPVPRGKGAGGGDDSVWIGPEDEDDNTQLIA